MLYASNLVASFARFIETGCKDRPSWLYLFMEYHRVGEGHSLFRKHNFCPKAPSSERVWVFHSHVRAAFGCIIYPTSANSHAPADCAVCEDDYAAALGYTCSKCSGVDGVVVAILALALASVVLAAVVVHLLSAPENPALIGARRTMIRTTLREVMQAISSPDLKTMVVSWQILTQVR